MFDLPTDTKKARKDYTYFRKNLLKDGFSMLQYSVYVRHCASEENADVHYNRIKSFLPPDGEVRLVTISTVPCHVLCLSLLGGNRLCFL
jgi:CRISPR-associated protein Cas2